MSTPDPEQGREVCTPCGGNGQVISMLGGDRHEVTCPWCRGTGRFQPGSDAQQAPSDSDSSGHQGAAESGPADRERSQPE